MINVAEIETRMKKRNLVPGYVAIELSKGGGRVTEREVRAILAGEVIPSWEHLTMLAIILDSTPWDLIKTKES